MPSISYRTDPGGDCGGGGQIVGVGPPGTVELGVGVLVPPGGVDGVGVRLTLEDGVGVREGVVEPDVSISISLSLLAVNLILPVPVYVWPNSTLVIH